MKRILAVICVLFIFGGGFPVFADKKPLVDQQIADGVPGEKQAQETAAVRVDPEEERKEASVKMLLSIIELKAGLKKRIADKKKALKATASDAEKGLLETELEKLDKTLAGANQDFVRIATGVDTGLFAEKETEAFNWQDELVSLVEPGIVELKRMTEKVRQKTRLKDELAVYDSLLPVALAAGENLDTLIERTRDRSLKKALKKLKPEWQGVADQIRNKLKVTTMQLAEMEAAEQSLIESTQASIKNFFRTRGLYLFIALFSCIAVILILRFIHYTAVKWAPGRNSRYRPFHMRALDLLFRVLTLVSTLFILILVFYIFEDWVLLSLAIVFLMGVGWTAKNTLPKFWHQSRLMLNIGAVREGERIIYLGVPWLVRRINVFTQLENPDLGETLRVPIENIMALSSRPFDRHEPWFPCRRNDWVILSDGTRGCVTSLSHEMVALVMRGGARKVYQTGDFLAQSPLNLSVNFRIKVLFGISYDLQDKATGTVLDTLEAFIQKRIGDEGYADSLLNLRVEFAQAGGSSLDLVVIADFKGDQAPLYNRISRAIQRWCTDACSENNWEIPFPQLTVHKGGNA